MEFDTHTRIDGPYLPTGTAAIAVKVDDDGEPGHLQAGSKIGHRWRKTRRGQFKTVRLLCAWHPLLAPMPGTE